MKPIPSLLLPPDVDDDDLDRFARYDAPGSIEPRTEPRAARIARPSLLRAPQRRRGFFSRLFAWRGY